MPTGKTQYYTATSLDGYIAAPNHSLDWLMQFSDEPTNDYPDFIASVGALAMGSSTYEWVLRHHVMPEGEAPKPWPYEQPTWIFTTRSLPRVAGADIRFVRGDVEPVHAEMMQAANGKNVWIVGGGDLAGQFYDRGLLDEMIVTIASVTLGAGAPLFPRALVSPPMRLVSVRAMGTAFAQLRYELPPIARVDEFRVLVDRYLSAYNRFDVEDMIAVLHPGVAFRNVSGGNVTAEAHGIAVFRDLAKRSAALFSSRNQTVRNYHRDGDAATIDVDYEGVLKADLSADHRAGDTLRLRGRTTFRFQDGLIAEIIDES